LPVIAFLVGQGILHGTAKSKSSNQKLSFDLVSVIENLHIHDILQHSKIPKDIILYPTGLRH
jgi:hypothetical protein